MRIGRLNKKTAFRKISGFFIFINKQKTEYIINKKNNLLKIKDCFFVRIIGLEPTRLAAPDPKSGMSTNFTISAKL